jgi:hypothetical protein
MAYIFTPATQPLCQSGSRSHSATQPLSHYTYIYAHIN